MVRISNFIGGLIFITSLSSLSKETSADIGTIMGVLIPLGMAMFGIALLKFGKYLARDESAFLIAFLIDLLDAEEINRFEQAAVQEPLIPLRP
jgi:NAD/NADP transhydrogenase beta subunit